MCHGARGGFSHACRAIRQRLLLPASFEMSSGIAEERGWLQQDLHDIVVVECAFKTSMPSSESALLSRELRSNLRSSRIDEEDTAKTGGVQLSYPKWGRRMSTGGNKFFDNAA